MPQASMAVHVPTSYLTTTQLRIFFFHVLTALWLQMAVVIDILPCHTGVGAPSMCKGSAAVYLTKFNAVTCRYRSDIFFN